MARNIDSDSLSSSEFYGPYTVAGAPNMLTINGGPCRRIRANETGTLIVTRTDGTSVTLNYLAGESKNIKANAVTGGTVTNIEVYW
jgi:hypothetical protein